MYCYHMIEVLHCISIAFYYLCTSWVGIILGKNIIMSWNWNHFFHIMKNLKYCFHCTYLLCFLYTVIISTQKFMEGRKIQEDSKTKLSSLQYPSVSVCVEYTYKKYIDDDLTSVNFTMEQVENLVKSKVWKRNETFYFVNHKTSARDDYPCMTRNDSSDPGRPCTFPFQYSAYSNKRNGVTFYNCSNIVSQEPWCYTKVDNQSHHCEYSRSRETINLHLMF